jgi:hypothetical protein
VRSRRLRATGQALCAEVFIDIGPADAVGVQERLVILSAAKDLCIASSRPKCIDPSERKTRVPQDDKIQEMGVRLLPRYLRQEWKLLTFIISRD